MLHRACEDVQGGDGVDLRPRGASKDFEGPAIQLHMTQRHALQALFSILFSTALLTGCDTMVVGGEAGAGGSGGGDPSGATQASTPSSGAGSAPQTTATVRAITEADRNEICSFAFPCDLPDGSVILSLDSNAPACGSPLMRQYGSGNGWRILIGIPASKLVPGIYDLSIQDLGFVVSKGFELDAGATAAAGPTSEGTLEIVSVDGLHLTVRTSGLTEGVFGSGPLDTDGEWVTQVCE